MLVVPKIPHFKHGDKLTSGSINHIIKRIEYGAELLKEFELADFQIPGNIVGYYYLQNYSGSSGFLYNGKNFIDINMVPRGVSGNRVVGYLDSSTSVIYENGKYTYFTPTGAVQSIPFGIYRDWVVGFYTTFLPSPPNQIKGYAYNLKTGELILIKYPGTAFNFTLGIYGESVLGIASLDEASGNTIFLYYIYKLGLDPNKKSSYLIIGSANTGVRYRSIGPNNSFCGYIQYEEAEQTTAFYDTNGVRRLIGQSNITGYFGSSANAITKNYVVGDGSAIIVNNQYTGFGFVYNINLKKAKLVLPPNAIASTCSGIDII